MLQFIDEVKEAVKFLEETHEKLAGLFWTQDKIPRKLVSRHAKRLLGQHSLLANEQNVVAFDGTIVKIAERRSNNNEKGFQV